jgi:hypothetical protein
LERDPRPEICCGSLIASAVAIASHGCFATTLRGDDDDADYRKVFDDRSVARLAEVELPDAKVFDRQPTVTYILVGWRY